MQIQSFSAPSSSFGYYRGQPNGMGQDQSSGMGPAMAGVNVFSAGQGGSSGGGAAAWSPTILYLFGLVIAEMVIFGIIGRRL